MDKLELMLEADRRGILPPEQKAMLDEAVKRGLVAQPQFGEAMNANVDSIPRQLGLTARSALEGAGDVVGTLAEPIRLPMSKALTALGLRDRPIPNASALATGAADAMGMPKPETRTERIANDATRLMAGGGLTMGAAGALPASGVAANVLGSMAANPGAQTAAAAGSGLAGGYTRETGGNPASKFIASLVGGVGAGVGVNAASRAADSVASAIRNIRNPQAATNQIDITIQNTLGDAVDFSAFPNHVRNQMRSDVAAAMQTGTLTPENLRRLADYRLSGATPTRAGLTLDPVDITRQRNLAKMGANSGDSAAQGMARLENENARRLGSGVQELGGNVTNDAYANSEKALTQLLAKDQARANAVGALYKNARDSLGRAAPLDHRTAADNAMLALANEQAAGLLPDKARNILNDISAGKTPFNVDTKEQIVRNLGKMMRGASDDEAFAIRLVRKALDDAPLTEKHGLGPDALEAFKAARTAHAARMRAQEATPALAAAADGVQPDAFFQQYVIGNNKGNVKALDALKLELGPDSEGFNALRGQLVAYLKRAGGVDEQVGTFNQAGFNNALESLGKAKLGVFFDKDELAKLRSIGNAAKYEQVQPRGSAVNNSNTAGAAFNILERLANSAAVTRIPIVGNVPRDMALRVRANQAQDIPAALAAPLPGNPALSATPILSPALAALMAQSSGTKENRK